MTLSKMAQRSGIVALIMLLLPVGSSLPSGIGGIQNGQDVALQGCSCHGDEPTRSVSVLLDGVPFAWEEGQTYPLTLQVRGGPSVGSGGQDYSAGFSMMVEAGSLAPVDGNTQNYQDNNTRLTHTSTGAGIDNSERIWNLEWTAPSSGEGHIMFYVAGNSVNGGEGNQGDMWNRLAFPVPEAGGGSLIATTMILDGDGNTEPLSEEEVVDLHHMGAKFRAHWLGLLGFASVIATIIFCGFMLRYGLSGHHKGRSNLLQLRIRLERRGDQ